MYQAQSRFEWFAGLVLQGALPQWMELPAAEAEKGERDVAFVVLAPDLAGIVGIAACWRGQVEHAVSYNAATGVDGERLGLSAHEAQRRAQEMLRRMARLSEGVAEPGVVIVPPGMGRGLLQRHMGMHG